ncbi:MAG: nitrile hydratase accessory protein, partial [Rhodospirillales bacterium]
RSQAAGDPDTGETYSNHWLAALERLCADKGLALGDEVANRAEEWRDAYLATPHGQAVALK